MNYAILKTGSKQYQVKTGDVIDVDKLPVEVGSWTELKEVLAVSRDGEMIIGRPLVPDASVLAQVQIHDRDKKITVFKYKRKVRYRRKKGHRQHYTRLTISGIFIGDEEIDAKQEVVAEEPTEEPVVEAADQTEGEPKDQLTEVEDEEAIKEDAVDAAEEVLEQPEVVTAEPVADTEVSQAEEATKATGRKRQTSPKVQAKAKTPASPKKSPTKKPKAVAKKPTTPKKSTTRRPKAEAKDNGA